MKGKKRKKKDGAAIVATTSILSILAVIALFIVIAWIVISTAQLGPTTLVQTYISTVTNAEGEEKYFMEAEYWENKDGSGKEVFEFTFNAYTDPVNHAILGKGVQFVSGEQRQGLERLLPILNQINDMTLEGWELKSYDLDERNGTSWGSLDNIGFGDPMYVNIGDQMYMTAMEGTYETYEKSLNLTKAIKNGIRCFFTDMNGFKHDENFKDVHVYTHEYTMADFYSAVIAFLMNTSAGYGSTVCNLVDLGKFFNVYKLDDKNRPELVTDATFNNAFFAVKVTKHYEGMRRAKESNFKQMLGDPEYTTVETDNLFNDYSSAEILPTLTGSDFDYYNVVSAGGYIAFVKDDVLSKLAAENITEIAVDINVNTNFFGDARNLIGISAESFGGLMLKDIRITLYQSDEKIEFNVYEASKFEQQTGLSIDRIEVSSVGKFEQNIELKTSDFPFIEFEVAV